MSKAKISKRWHWPLFLALGVALLASGQDIRRQQARRTIAGMRVFIDPVTGAIREAEQEELQALTAATATTATAPQVISDADSTLSVLLTEDEMAYSVATIGPDGKLQMKCITGKKNAESEVHAAAGKEPFNVR